MKKSILKIKDIKIDEKLYPREHLNKSVVNEYVKDMKKGDVFPAIYVALFKGKYLLVDGMHRLEAYEILGEKYIQAEIKDNFPSMNDIFLASVRSNLKHGLRLTEKDKTKIAYIMKNMKFDVKDISGMTGIAVEKFELIKYSIKDVIKEHKFPDKLSFKNEKETERQIGVIDATGGKAEVLTKKELAISYQKYFLDDCYKMMKKEKFYMENKEIKTLINKIIKVLRGKK